MSQETRAAARGNSRTVGIDLAGNSQGRDGAVPTGPLAHARHGVFGFLMGMADLVPGVSGGTVALVCGIYARLINAVRDGVHAVVTLLRGRVRDGLGEVRRLDWALLVPLLTGIGLAVVSLAALIEHLLDEQPVAIAGLFLGLVLGSAVVASRLIRRVDAQAVLIAAGVAIGLFILLGLRQETTADAADAATAPVWAFPAAASLAICAMILPGVSGSLLLVMMGMYAHVLAAVNDRDIGLLALFLLGAVVGLGLFSRLLAWLLGNHHDRVVAAMIGLMLGSMRVLWPWPDGTSSTSLATPSGEIVVPVVLAVAGFVVVLAIGRLGILREEPAPSQV
jgi:putative membrane protein